MWKDTEYFKNKGGELPPLDGCEDGVHRWVMNDLCFLDSFTVYICFRYRAISHRQEKGQFRDGVELERKLSPITGLSTEFLITKEAFIVGSRAKD